MYAIIETGGKQVRVEEGQEIYVEKLDGEAGDTFTFEQVLMLGGDNIVLGNPYVLGAKVVAEVVKNGRGKKITVFHYSPKKDFRKKQGHRQAYTKLVIKSIEA